MSQPIELIPLKCVKCDTPVQAESGEFAWVCTECGQALHLDNEEGLIPIEVCYQAGIPEGQLGRPFWVASFEFHFGMEREVFGSDMEDIQTLEDFWASHHRFYIPAFPCTVKELLNLSKSYFLRAPECQAGPPVPFISVALSMNDLMPYAEFLIYELEADRSDHIKEIEFDLKISQPELWILPNS